MGIGDEKLLHVGADPLPGEVYTAAEAAIVQYAQKSTRLEPIDNGTYRALASHFSAQQIMDICFNVGLAQLINRFHATFLSVVDDYILEANERAEHARVSAAWMRSGG